MKRIIEGPYAYGCVKGHHETICEIVDPLMDTIASKVGDKITPNFMFLTGTRENVNISDPVAMDSLSGDDFVRTEKYRTYREPYRTLLLIELDTVEGLVVVDFPRAKMAHYMR